MAKAKTLPSKKRTTIYLPDALLWKMREIRAKLRLSSDTQAVEVALTEWVNRNEGGANAPSVPPPKKGRHGFNNAQRLD